MTSPRLLPGVFTAQQHLVAADATAHGSAHLGSRYRALCRALCLPAPANPRYTWRRWPICPACTALRVAAQPHRPASTPHIRREQGLHRIVRTPLAC